VNLPGQNHFDSEEEEKEEEGGGGRGRRRKRTSSVFLNISKLYITEKTSQLIQKCTPIKITKCTPF
jgi:hypothetical protein